MSKRKTLPRCYYRNRKLQQKKIKESLSGALLKYFREETLSDRTSKC